jgi:hypothetical protein
MKLNEKVVCADGFEMSVQASATAYSIPRMTDAPTYIQVEVGFPSEAEELLTRWAEDEEDPTGTVYGYVPVNVVTNVIAKHGGIVSGEVPRGVIPLEAQ